MIRQDQEDGTRMMIPLLEDKYSYIVGERNIDIDFVAQVW